MSASEELSFTLDSDACLSAQNDLINLGKRLTSEIGWFPDLDKDSVIQIQERIDANEELATDGLTQISKLNATLYNFAISKETDLYEIGYAILDIDEQYSALDIAEITSTINKNRESAKIALVQEKDVSNEINKKRDDIRQIITEQLSTKNLPELYENIAYPLLHGADYVLLNRFLPGGRGLRNTEFLLSLEETNEMLDVAEEVLSKAGRYGHVGTELPLCALKNPDKYSHIWVSSLCAAAKEFCVIDPSGYLKVCNHSPTRICHYTELETLKENAYWNAFQSRTYIPQMCNGCDKRDRCDGGCREAAHVFYGDINDNDPLFHCY